MSSSLFPLNMLPQIISIRPRARLSSTYAPPLRTATAYLQTTQGRRKREKGRRERQGGQQSDTRPSFRSSFFPLPFCQTLRPYFLANFWTRPSASMNFRCPVKNGWQREQISTRMSFFVEPVTKVVPQEPQTTVAW